MNPSLLPALILCAALAPVAAQEAVPPAAASAPAAPPIEYPSVAEALKALSARDGQGTIVIHSDGWTIVNDALAGAQWSFTPPEHAAHPSVVRRIVKRDPRGTASVETASLCEATAKTACTSLLAEFESMNERIVQSVRARARQGSTPSR